MQGELRYVPSLGLSTGVCVIFSRQSYVAVNLALQLVAALCAFHLDTPTAFVAPFLQLTSELE